MDLCFSVQPIELIPVDNNREASIICICN
jgi:hypothetical protein